MSSGREAWTRSGAFSSLIRDKIVKLYKSLLHSIIMNKKSFGKWIAVGATFLGLGLYENFQPVNLREYVNEHLEEIIEEQEEALGIKHFYPRPQTRFELLDQLSTLRGVSMRVIYTPEDDTITFYSQEEKIDGDLVKELLLHELGHFYTDKLKESLGDGNWPPKTGSCGLRIVAEGIGEYFERKITGKSDTFQDSDWSFFKNIQEGNIIPQRIVYDGGYHLVKSILDSYFSKGMIYLMENPPSNEDVKDILTYQRMVLKALEEQNKYRQIRF